MNIIRKPDAITLRDGPDGQMAVVAGSCWEPSFSDYLRSHSVRELQLNAGRGWKGTDLQFLSELPKLTNLLIIGGMPKKNVDSIENLKQLRVLVLQSSTVGRLSLAQLPALRHAVLEWQPRIVDLDACAPLESLALLHYSKTNCKVLESLVNLKALYLSAGSIRTLDGIERCGRLESLGLYRLTKLVGLSALSRLGDTLVKLDIDGCKQLESIEPFRSLDNLQSLALNDCGTIASFAPLRGMSRLTSLTFYGSTNVADGDLTSLRSLNLDRIDFEDHPHYSETRKNFGVAGTQRAVAVAPVGNW